DDGDTHGRGGPLCGHKIPDSNNDSHIHRNGHNRGGIGGAFHGTGLHRLRRAQAEDLLLEDGQDA
ncbi:hypothetical protein LCGC14_2537860, partial [marine sediment metagenome]